MQKKILLLTLFVLEIFLISEKSYANTYINPTSPQEFNQSIEITNDINTSQIYLWVYDSNNTPINWYNFDYTNPLTYTPPKQGTYKFLTCNLGLGSDCSMVFTIEERQNFASFVSIENYTWKPKALTPINTRNLILESALEYGQSLVEIILSITGILIGLLIIKSGIHAIWHSDGTTNWLGSHWSFYDKLTYKPWKSYNRFRSRKWNLKKLN